MTDIQDEFSLFPGESGLFTDYDGTIVDCTFAPTDYGWQANVTFDAEGAPKGEPWTEWYKVPEGWTSTDGGETIYHPDPAKKLHKLSKYYKFVVAAQSCGPDAQDYLRTRAAQLKLEPGNWPMNAAIWIGSRWHMTSFPGGSFKDKKTGKVTQGNDYNLPTAFLGTDAVESNGSGTATTNMAETLLGSVPVNVAELIRSSATTLTHSKWLEAGITVMRENDVDPNAHPDLIAAMGNPTGLYAELKG